MAVTMPKSIDRSSPDGCAHTLDLDYYVLCYGWLRPYHIYHVLEISVVPLYANSPAATFSVACVLVKHFTPLSQASCFRGHLLHNNLSPFVTVPVTPLPHFGGLIPRLVRSDITWKHLHYVPLSMDFICPEEISCRISLKSPLFLLAQIQSVLPAPMGEILQRGRASWVWESFLTNARAKVLSFRLMKLFKNNANPMDVVINLISLSSIHNIFLRINPIP